MIAYTLSVGDDELPGRSGSRAGRTAAQARRRRAIRAKHRVLAFILIGLTAATLFLLSSLWLMAGAQRLSYDLEKLHKTAVGLRDQSARYEDRIAQLESRDRLAAIAERLGMSDPRRFAVATVPPEEKPRGLAFLPSPDRWLH
jgi:cell division protein FtsL